MEGRDNAQETPAAWSSDRRVTGRVRSAVSSGEVGFCMGYRGDGTPFRQ